RRLRLRTFLLACTFLFLRWHSHQPDLHSFPTRRSSDLIELSSQRREGLRESMEQILAAGLEKGLVLDATIGESVEQAKTFWRWRSEEHTSELQSRGHLVCRLLLEIKNDGLLNDYTKTRR